MDGRNGLEVFTKYSRISLSCFGSWPSDNKNKTLSAVLFLISFTIILFCLFIPQAVRAVQVWGNLDKFTEVMCVAEIPYLVALTKISVLFYKKKRLSVLYNHMIDHWENNISSQEMEIMMKTGRRGRKIGLICISLGSTAVVTRFLQTLAANFEPWKSPEHYKNFTLYVDCYFPFTWNYTPVFEVIYSIVSLANVVSTNAYSGPDSFFSQLILHFSGQYQILRLRLLNVVNQMDKKKSLAEFDEKFSKVVDFHEHINSCIETMESIFNLMFLVQLLACTIQFCLQGYLLVMYSTDENYNSIGMDMIFIVLFLLYIIGNFYVYCYLADTLQMESLAFAKTAYECEWYNLSPQKAKYIILLMQCGNKPVEITAGKFCVLNLILFGSMIKTSMGYLSFLITMRKASKQ